MVNSPRPILIDCDPGVDDAVMLIMALGAARSVKVHAITTVAGNVPLSLTSRNARMICQLAGRTDIQVHAGCDRPFLRAPVTAEDFHGESGIAGLDPFEPDTPPGPGHASDVILSALDQYDRNTLTLIITGPMTNLALAILRAPETLRHVKEIIVMAGADTAGGNITPYAEFNVFADPHAAAIVFNSGLPVTIASLDITQTVRAEPKRIKQIAAIDTDRAALTVKLLEAANQLESRWKAGHCAPMHDPSTITYLLRPDIFEARRALVSVQTDTGDEFGRTQVAYAEDGPHLWLTKADADKYFALLEEILEGKC